MRKQTKNQRSPTTGQQSLERTKPRTNQVQPLQRHRQNLCPPPRQQRRHRRTTSHLPDRKPQRKVKLWYNTPTEPLHASCNFFCKRTTERTFYAQKKRAHRPLATYFLSTSLSTWKNSPRVNGSSKRSSEIPLLP